MSPDKSKLASYARSWMSSLWVRFILRKLWTVMLSFLFLIVVTFLIVQFIPGDPARAVAGNEASADVVETVRKSLGLNDPIGLRFWHYVQNIASGSLGESYRMGNVGDLIMTRVPYTVGVAGISIAITLVLSLLFGLLVAVLTREGRRPWLDIAFSAITATIDAIPVYVRATLLIIVFALTLHLFPAGGAQNTESFVLPILALSIGPVCSLSRVVRREAQSVLHSEFIRTTKGWRLKNITIYLKYVLPNVMTSTLTMSGLMLSGMIGGALVMEKVFSWPGLGTSVVDAIIHRDYPVVQGTILVLGMVAVFINITIDVILAIIDPRNLQPRSES